MPRAAGFDRGGACAQESVPDIAGGTQACGMLCGPGRYPVTAAETGEGLFKRSLRQPKRSVCGQPGNGIRIRLCGGAVYAACPAGGCGRLTLPRTVVRGLSCPAGRRTAFRCAKTAAGASLCMRLAGGGQGKAREHAGRRVFCRLTFAPEGFCAGETVADGLKMCGYACRTPF